MIGWGGTEVKPGKPYTHSFDPVRGRLHISQATLAPGSLQKKTSLQCNVGDKSPILLCVLLPDKTESCKLDLEFAEANQVVFSVVGPRAVFLTGLRESYGVDIANTESEESNHSTDEDEYEDSFINDGDPETLSRSPISSSGVIFKLVKDDTEDTDSLVTESKGKLDALVIDDDPKRMKPQKQTSEEETLAADIDNHSNVEVIAQQSIGHDLQISHEQHHEPTTDNVPALESIIKPNRKRKRRSKAQQAEEQGFMLMRRKLNEKQTEKREIGLPYDSEQPDMKEGSEDGPRAKRRRKEWAAELQEGNNLSDVLKEDQAKKDEVKVENMGKDHKPGPDKIILTDSDKLANGHPSEKEKARKTKKNKKFKSKLQDNEEHVSSKEGCNRSKQEHEVKNVDARSSTSSSGLIIEVLELGNCDGKFASPGKKGQASLHLQVEGEWKSNRLKYWESSLQVPARYHHWENIVLYKDSLRYVTYFDALYTLHAGDEKVPEGWNVGVDGLRVGDKRRLTVPPSTGADVTKATLSPFLASVMKSYFVAVCWGQYSELIIR
ncbi:hypothetical protein RJ639_025338 [Escallonia herrerae]|uniref:peptidylprolyl isomerase n=1 Tax=Escallonia herrerae TaxID=1293975 RepID=A0AA88UXC6_9ASTE|nr:hypothetical protein RJ639_025338 [Escallonia herrerae]